MPDPVLHTEHLTLRPLTAALAADLLTASSSTANSFTGGAAEGFPSDDDAHVLRAVLADGPDARGAFVLEFDGRAVGTAGSAGVPSPQGDQEIGFGLVPAARNRGLGTEAVAAVAAHLERGDGVRRLTAEVLPGNLASLRLLRRLGFVDIDGGTGGRVLLARAAPGQPAVPGRTVSPSRIVGRHVC